MPTRPVRLFPVFNISIACLTALLWAGCTERVDSPEVTLERARIHAERGEFTESIPLYTKAVAAFPQRAEVFYLRGVAYENLDLLDRALEDYAKCLELDSSYTEAINNFGVVLARLKRHREAVEQFSRLISLKADDALALRNRGLCYHDLGESQKAIDDYNRAIEIAPQDAQTWFQRGNVHLDDRNYATAEADFSKAIATDNQLAKAWMNRGIARLRLGRRDEALLDLSKGQELDENIIVPGMDFLEEAPTADSGTSEQSFLSVAETNLAERGFTELKQLTSNASMAFAVYDGFLDGASVRILATGLLPRDFDPESRQILVPQEFMDASPAESATPRSRTVMVLKQTKTDDPSWTVLEIIPNWQPDTGKIQPHILRIAI